jgi:uncharacterized protein YjbI with pentapeptide repeats
LSNSDLSCADLSNANLENANLENADLNCADLSGAKLSNANLTNADFSDAIVENAKFNNNLGISSELKQDLINRGAIFEDFLIQKDIPPKIPNNPISFNLVFANLIRGNLGGAFRILKNLSRANLSGANLRDANLSGTKVEKARFGYNPGITEYMKHDLKQRGAIFEDSTGDRSFIFTR